MKDKRPDGARLRAIIKRTDEEYGHVTNVSVSLENLQRTVDGYIETVSFAGGFVVVCNEEGLLRDLPYNCNIGGVDFVGDIIVLGWEPLNEDFVDCPVDFRDWKTLVDEGKEE